MERRGEDTTEWYLVAPARHGDAVVRVRSGMWLGETPTGELSFQSSCAQVAVNVAVGGSLALSATSDHELASTDGTKADGERLVLDRPAEIRLSHNVVKFVTDFLHPEAAEETVEVRAARPRRAGKRETAPVEEAPPPKPADAPISWREWFTPSPAAGRKAEASAPSTTPEPTVVEAAGERVRRQSERAWAMPEPIAREPAPQPQPVPPGPKSVTRDPEPERVIPEPIAREPAPQKVIPEPIAREPEPQKVVPEPIASEPERARVIPEPLPEHVRAAGDEVVAARNEPEARRAPPRRRFFAHAIAALVLVAILAWVGSALTSPSTSDVAESSPDAAVEADAPVLRTPREQEPAVVPAPDVTDIETTAAGVARTVPEVVANAPEVATSAPGVAADTPGDATSAPGVATRAPEVAADAPEVATRAPEVATSAPGVASAPPVEQSLPPVRSAPPPAAETDTPVAPPRAATPQVAQSKDQSKSTAETERPVAPARAATPQVAQTKDEPKPSDATKSGEPVNASESPPPLERVVSRPAEPRPVVDSTPTTAAPPQVAASSKPNDRAPASTVVAKPPQPAAPPETAPSQTELLLNALASADIALVEGRLTTPQGSNAYALYQRALRLDPSSAEAKRGIESVRQGLINRALAQLAGGALEDARRTLQSAADAGADPMLVANLRNEVDYRQRMLKR